MSRYGLDIYVLLHLTPLPPVPRTAHLAESLATRLPFTAAVIMASGGDEPEMGEMWIEMQKELAQRKMLLDEQLGRIAALREQKESELV